MIEKPKNGVSHPKNYLLKKLPPPPKLKKKPSSNYINIMIEKKPKLGCGMFKIGQLDTEKLQFIWGTRKVVIYATIVC